MRPLALAAILLLAACPAERAPTPKASAPASGSAATPAGWTAAQQACVDGWLGDHGLDAYGSPKGTLYSGGTPLFDETTGHSLTRQDFLRQHHPDVLRSCGL